MRESVSSLEVFWNIFSSLINICSFYFRPLLWINFGVILLGILFIKFSKSPREIKSTETKITLVLGISLCFPFFLSFYRLTDLAFMGYRSFALIGFLLGLILAGIYLKCIRSKFHRYSRWFKLEIILLYLSYILICFPLGTALFLNYIMKD